MGRGGVTTRSGRFVSLEAFRETVAALGLPTTDDELATLWEMIADLHEQADGLRRYLEQRLGSNPLSG